MLECGMTFDFGQLMIDNEMINMFKRVLRGEETTEETLDLDEIHKVGPHGHYMASSSTKKYMRAQSRHKIFDRMNMFNWTKKGSPDPYQIALGKAREILENHQVEPLSDSVSKDIRKLIVETEKEWGVEVKNPDFNPTQGFLHK